MHLHTHALAQSCTCAIMHMRIHICIRTHVCTHMHRQARPSSTRSKSMRTMTTRCMCIHVHVHVHMCTCMMCMCMCIHQSCKVELNEALASADVLRAAGCSAFIESDEGLHHICTLCILSYNDSTAGSSGVYHALRSIKSTAILRITWHRM